MRNQQGRETTRIEETHEKEEKQTEERTQNNTNTDNIAFQVDVLGARALPLADVLARYPVALLLREEAP